MVIDVHGPQHYRNNTGIPMDSMIYINRIVKAYHKHYLIIPYQFYDSIMANKMETDLKANAMALKKLIDEEMANKA